jgi:UDP-2-acetamido-3-amino-2,3-dideoxy-glucuronate N-acetyltransferase
MSHISATANIGTGVLIGEHVVVADDVVIGEGSRIGNNVVLHAGTTIGRECRVDDNTVVGKQPMRAHRSATTTTGVLPPAIIGDHVLVGTSVVIYAGCTIASRVLVADLSSIRENVTIGAETIIGRGVAVENYCTIGSRCKLETNVYITAYSSIEDDVFIAPGVITSNDNFVGRTQERFKHYKGVTIRRGGRIGANATILPGKVIGEDALVAAGAVVTGDVPPRKIFAGVPAKELRDVPPEQLLENQ